MTSSSPTILQRNLARLAAHIVVALVALVVVGGATRVMEAGLACPDWPLCYGSLLPGGKMNVQVFLEWFHRLDAFLVGIALLTQLGLGIFYRSQLPKWLLWSYGLMVFLVSLQGLLGALTVLKLLPSFVVASHLTMAFVLLSIMSGVAQSLLTINGATPPLWWKPFCGLSLFAVIAQSLIGALMATSWSAQRCIAQSEACNPFELHRFFAMPVALLLLAFIVTAFLAGGWARKQWPFLIGILSLLTLQIVLGILTVNSSLNEPLIRIAHQLIAALLVATLAGLSSRRSLPLSKSRILLKDSYMEACHG